MSRRYPPVFVESRPVAFDVEDPLIAAPRHGKAGFESLLAGRVVGTFKQVPRNQPVELLNIAGANESAMAITVQLLPENLRPDRPAANSYTPPTPAGYTNQGMDDAVALVTWGVGGVLSYAEVDMHRGATFTVFASSLQVMAFRGNTYAGTAAAVGWGAFAAHLPRAAYGPGPTRSYFAETVVVVGGTQRYDRPPFAVDVQALRYTAASPTSPLQAIRVDQLDYVGTPIASDVVGLGTACPRIPLHNHTERIGIYNLAAAENLTRTGAIWGLAL